MRLNPKGEGLRQARPAAARGGRPSASHQTKLTAFKSHQQSAAPLSEPGDKRLRKIHELACSLHENVNVDWAVHDSVRAMVRLLVKQLPRKYKYLPVQEYAAVALVMY